APVTLPVPVPLPPPEPTVVAVPLSGWAPATGAEPGCVSAVSDPPSRGKRGPHAAVSASSAPTAAKVLQRLGREATHTLRETSWRLVRFRFGVPAPGSCLGRHGR